MLLKKMSKLGYEHVKFNSPVLIISHPKCIFTSVYKNLCMISTYREHEI